MAFGAARLLAAKVPEGLREKLYGFLVQADKEKFIYTASLAGSIALAYNSLLKLNEMKSKVQNSVALGKMDAGMGKFLIRGSARAIINSAVLGAALGAGTGALVFKQFHGLDETDPLQSIL